MTQLSLSLECSPPPVSPERRLDITLQAFVAAYEALPEAEQIKLSEKSWLNAIAMLHRVRAMERGEEEALGRPALGSVADIYDRCVRPGEQIISALLRVFEAALSAHETKSSSDE